MYLTAQRVVCLKDGSQGINTYCYRHGGELAGDEPVGYLDEPPGIRVKSNLMVQTTGNRIRSFLDIVGPDTWATSEILGAFQTFLEKPPEEFPWIVSGPRWAIRFDCESLLAASWEREAKLLFESISTLIA